MIHLIPENETASKKIIEQGLGSIGKIKIIRALAEEDRMITIYSLHKKTRLKREDIKRNLSELISIDWVNELKMGNTMYSLNKNNKYIIYLISFFENVGYISR